MKAQAAELMVDAGDDLVEVYVADRELDAHEVEALLLGAGIYAKVVGESLPAGLWGQASISPTTVRVDVCIFKPQDGAKTALATCCERLF